MFTYLWDSKHNMQSENDLLITLVYSVLSYFYEFTFSILVFFSLKYRYNSY